MPSIQVRDEPGRDVGHEADEDVLLGGIEVEVDPLADAEGDGGADVFGEKRFPCARRGRRCRSTTPTFLDQDDETLSRDVAGQPAVAASCLANRSGWARLGRWLHPGHTAKVAWGTRAVSHRSYPGSMSEPKIDR